MIEFATRIVKSRNTRSYWIEKTAEHYYHLPNATSNEKIFNRYASFDIAMDRLVRLFS